MVPRHDAPRRAAVSSFGFGGSNFHCVLEEHRPWKAEVAWDGSVQIAAFSGNSVEGVRDASLTWLRGRDKVFATTRPLYGLFNNWPHFSRALDKTMAQMVHAEFRVANRHNGRDPWFTLTRAEDRLYVCGRLGLRAAPEKGWHELVSEAFPQLPGALAAPLEDWPAPSGIDIE